MSVWTDFFAPPFGFQIVSGLPFKGALVVKSGTQSIANATNVDVTWQTVIYDTDAFFSGGSPTKLTVPAGVTRVRLSGVVDWSATGVQNKRAVQILKNDAVFDGFGQNTRIDSGTASDEQRQGVVSAIVDVDEGDFFEINVRQTSGGGKNVEVNSWFAIEVVETIVVPGDPAQVVQTLADGANISWNHNTSRTAQVTLAGNRVLDNPTNSIEGLEYTLKVIQDGTGTRLLTYGSAYKFAGGTAPTLSTGVNDIDILRFWFDGTDYINIGFEANVS